MTKTVDPISIDALNMQFHNAIMDNDVALVSSLLSRGDIDINKAAANGKTPLEEAVCYGHVEIVKLLLNKDGIDINKAGRNGKTPLEEAVCVKRI